MPSSSSGPTRSVALIQDEAALTEFLWRAPAERQDSLEGNVVAFCRLLRAGGIEVTVGRVLDAARALQAVDVTLREDTRAALAATLLWDVSQRALFDALFNVFWSLTVPPAGVLPPPQSFSRSRGPDGPAASRKSAPLPAMVTPSA